MQVVVGTCRVLYIAASINSNTVPRYRAAAAELVAFGSAFGSAFGCSGSEGGEKTPLDAGRGVIRCSRVSRMRETRPWSVTQPYTEAKLPIHTRDANPTAAEQSQYEPPSPPFTPRWISSVCELGVPRDFK